MAFKLAGLGGFQFLGGDTTECMIAWNDDLAIVAFRGTEIKSLSALREIRTDLNAIPLAFPEGGRVHKEFYKALEEIWEGPTRCRLFLESLIKMQPERPVWFTGHSLGGALASLAFARMPSAKGLYVFGSPRVGDRAFAELTLNRPVWRVENANDPIPLVPPDVPALGLNFVPIGTLVHIAKDGSIESDRAVFDLREQGQKARKMFAKQSARIAAIDLPGGRLLPGRPGLHDPGHPDLLQTLSDARRKKEERRARKRAATPPQPSREDMPLP